METIGAYLKRIREERGLSIDQVTLKTRINKGYLRALEENRLEDFPGEVFARGFVRVYGRCLGLDDDETMARFDQSAAHFFRERDESKRTSEQSVEQEKSRKAFQGRMIQFAVMAALAIAIVTVYTLNSRNLKRAQEGAKTSPPPTAGSETDVPVQGPLDLSEPAVNKPGTEPQPVKPARVPAPPGPTAAPKPPTAPPKPSEGPAVPPEGKMPLIVNVPGKPDAPPAPAAPTGPAAPPVPAAPPNTGTTPAPVAPPAAAVHPPVASSGKTLILEIEAVEPAWVAAKIDGGDVKEVFLRPGDKVTWNASDHFMVSFGNAGGVKVVFDGKPLPSLGASGEVVKNVRFPRE